MNSTESIDASRFEEKRVGIDEIHIGDVIEHIEYRRPTRSTVSGSIPGVGISIPYQIRMGGKAETHGMALKHGSTVKVYCPHKS